MCSSDLMEKLARQSLKDDFLVQPRLANPPALDDIANGALATVRLQGIAVGATALTLTGATAALNNATALTVSPTNGTATVAALFLVVSSPASATGPAGTPVTFQGGGFNANSTVTISWDSPAGTLTTATASGTGAFNAAAATLPTTGNAAGAHTITATDGGGHTTTATFTVVTPAVTPSPTSGLVGDTITVTGSNFAPNVAVSVTLGGTSVASPTAGATGEIGRAHV